MTCKGLNWHVSIIQERKDHSKGKRRPGKTKTISKMLKTLLDSSILERQLKTHLLPRNVQRFSLELTPWYCAQGIRSLFCRNEAAWCSPHKPYLLPGCLQLSSSLSGAQMRTVPTHSGLSQVKILSSASLTSRPAALFYLYLSWTGSQAPDQEVAVRQLSRLSGFWCELNA